MSYHVDLGVFRKWEMRIKTYRWATVHDRADRTWITREKARSDVPLDRVEKCLSEQNRGERPKGANKHQSIRRERKRE